MYPKYDFLSKNTNIHNMLDNIIFCTIIKKGNI